VNELPPDEQSQEGQTRRPGRRFGERWWKAMRRCTSRRT
jgi:hypothetical protein